MPDRIRQVEVELGVKGIRPVELRCKSIEITLPVKGIRLVDLGGNPLRSKAFNRQCNRFYVNGFTPNLTSIYLNGFTPNSPDQI